MHPDKKVRRIQTSLRTNGYGYILFTIWDIFKTILLLLLDPQQYNKIFKPLEYDNVILEILSFGIFILFTGLISYIHIYIGRSAIAEANGKKKSHKYLILAVFVLVASLAISLTSNAYNFLYQNSIKNIIEMFIDLTVDCILLGLIIDAIRLKKYEVKACS